MRETPFLHCATVRALSDHGQNVTADFFESKRGRVASHQRMQSQTNDLELSGTELENGGAAQPSQIRNSESRSRDNLLALIDALSRANTWENGVCQSQNSVGTSDA